MSEENMNDLAKLAVFIAGVGSVLYGIRLPDADVTKWVFIIPGAVAILGVLLLLAGKGNYAKKLGFTSGMSSAAAAVIVLIIVAIGVLALKNAGILSINAPGIELPGVGGGEEQEGELIALTLPIRFTFAAGGVSFAALDSLANPPAATLESVAIYKDGVLVETISPSAPGGGGGGMAAFGPYEAVTSMKYRSGDRLHLVLTYDIGGGNYAVQSVDVVVPYVNKEEAEILPPVEHDITVDVGVVPASVAAVNVYDDTGAVASSLAPDNTYTLNVILPEDHAGFVTAAVPQATGGEIKYVGGIIIEANASTLDIPGARLVYQGVGKYIYFVQASGDITVSFKYVGGAPTSVSITAYQGIDLDYVSRLGKVNPEAVAIGSVSLTGSA